MAKEPKWTTLEHDSNLLAQYPWVLGMDEVGRGCVAGPLTVSGVIVTPSNLQALSQCVCDSKLLSPKRRQAAYEYLMGQDFLHFTSSISAETIDSKGISFANIEAFDQVTRAARQAQPGLGLSLADGNLWKPQAADLLPAQSLIKGELLSVAIAAASVIAKVTRDTYMTELSDTHPAYGLSGHKGYGTKQHLTAIQSEGAIKGLHRMTFLTNYI
jgi:ribonuclease HII